MTKIILYITILITAGFIIISKIFSPIWLLVLVLALLWYHQKEEDIRPVFLFNIIILLFYFILHYFSILIPFIIGLGFAYILAPLVDLLEKKKMPRVLAILMLILPIIVIFPLILFLIVVGLINELQFLIEKIPDAIQQIQIYFGAMLNRFAELGIKIDPNFVANTITDQLTNILSGLFKTIGQIGKGIRDIFMLIYNLIFIPLSAYLFLVDRKEISNWFKNLFPSEEKKPIAEFIERLNISLARFFRGQIILMLLVGFIVGFALWIFGIKYYLLLGIIAGLCNLIPNVGFILSFIPAILIGLLSPTPLVSVIKIVAIYIGEQLLENLVLGPMIIGKASRLHPVVVMVVLVLGGAVFGVWGVILAVPLTIFAREFLNYFLKMKI